MMSGRLFIGSTTLAKVACLAARSQPRSEGDEASLNTTTATYVNWSSPISSAYLVPKTQGTFGSYPNANDNTVVPEQPLHLTPTDDFLKKFEVACVGVDVIDPFHTIESGTRNVHIQQS
ncbi:MAG: hypothetical protein MMC23_001235 [Stictis urceolatum]|nr:hypothetical protein [Stictis urceolata]